MNSEAFVQRYSSRYSISESGCWLWKGSMQSNGYCQIQIKSKSILVHRLAWEVFHGPIPKGLFVCHKCDVRNCVNPEHLFLGTNMDNIKDMLKKGRSPHFSRILTEEEVLKIKSRLKAGRTILSIAEELGVSRYAVRDIKRGNTWKHINLLPTP